MAFEITGGNRFPLDFLADSRAALYIQISPVGCPVVEEKKGVWYKRVSAAKRRIDQHSYRGRARLAREEGEIQNENLWLASTGANSEASKMNDRIYFATSRGGVSPLATLNGSLRDSLLAQCFPINAWNKGMFALCPVRTTDKVSAEKHDDSVRG